MLKELNYDSLEIVAATRNISVFDGFKTVNTTITMLRLEDSVHGLTGLERAFRENELFNDNRYVKLSTVYSLNEKSEIVPPIKVLFNHNEKYITKALYERDVNPEIIADVVFVDNVFDTTDDNLKRVY